MLSHRIRKPIAVTGLVLCLALIASAPALQAQAVSIATVSGRIVDTQGAVVSGAQIKMTAVNTGSVHNAVTNGDGIYTIPSLPIGPYTLEATAPGFQTYVQSGINLQVNDNVQMNVTMKVGQVAERVEVQANASMVQTQQNTISQVIDQRRIVDLPLNGRDPTQLITISGAAINHNDGTNTGTKSFFSSQSISIAGSAGDATNYLLDGGDNNDSFTNVNMPFPFPDALAEFSVETSALPARNGLHPGGVVNMVTKSGSNEWHGDLFEFIRNGDVNAINYFATRQDNLKRNQFGGILGGKIQWQHGLSKPVRAWGPDVPSPEQLAARAVVPLPDWIADQSPDRKRQFAERDRPGSAQCGLAHEIHRRGPDSKALSVCESQSLHGERVRHIWQCCPQQPAGASLYRCRHAAQPGIRPA